MLTEYANTPLHRRKMKTYQKENPLSSVGLSYSLQSYRNFIQVSHNIYTGELKVQPKSTSLLTKHKSENTHDRYKRSGKLFVEGLTIKGKAKIQKATRVLENVYKFEEGLKSYCSMITLTYGKDYPTDHESKLHLNHFLKRLKRLHPNCKYVWVAEKQKRGAIHYHILTPYYTDKEWVNNSWNEIVGKWQSKQNLKPQTLLPNVIKVNRAGSYIAKYLSKEGHKIGGNGYGIDQQTRALMKDESVYLIHHDQTPEEINEIVNSIQGDITTDKPYKTWKSKYTSYVGLWTPEFNRYGLKEFLQYKRHDYGLITENELLANKIVKPDLVTT